MELFKILGTVAIDGVDKAESALGKVGGTAKKVGKVIGAGIAAGATAVAALTKSAVDSYAENEQLVGGSKLMFGDAYDFIADKAKSAYQNVQMSQNDYLKQVNGLATGLKTSLGGNAQLAAELADKIITAEADIVAATGSTQEEIQNAFNGIMKSNFTMLDNLKLGITPTKEGFQEVIDKVNEWNKANGEATDYVIDNLADCQSALVDYVEMQGMAGYAGAEAADTISGSLAMTKAAWQNLLVGFADETQDLDFLVGSLVDSVTIAAGKIVPKIAKILGGISDAMAQFMPIIAAELPAILEELLPGVIQGATALISGLIQVLPDLLAILTAQLPSVITQLSVALIEVFPILLETCKQLFGQLWDYIAVELLGTSADFETTFSKISEIFGAVWTYISTYWETIGRPIFDILRGCVETVSGVFGEKMPEIEQFVSECFSDISDFWENNLKPCFEAIGDFIENVLAPVVDAVFTVAIGGVVETVFNTIEDLWENTLKPVFTGINDFLTGIFTGDWEQALNGILGIATGVWNGIQTAIETPMEAAKNFVNEAIEFLQEAFDFNWELPQIKLPHFRVSGGEAPWGFGGKGSLPSVGVDWYAKGGVLEEPTIFGMNGNRLMGGGEAGAEAVAPIDVLQGYVAEAVASQNAGLVAVLERILGAIIAMDANMGGNLREALDGTSLSINHREFGRLVKAVN